eukprot:10545473-Ditylum_brightwellii.AAC.1
MEKTDKRKFSVDSPKHQDDAYMRLWDLALQVSHSMGWQSGVPSSERIIEDMSRIHEYSIIKRFQGTRRGRCDDGIKTMGPWGGQRE